MTKATRLHTSAAAAARARPGGLRQLQGARRRSTRPRRARPTRRSPRRRRATTPTRRRPPSRPRRLRRRSRRSRSITCPTTPAAQDARGQGPDRAPARPPTGRRSPSTTSACSTGRQGVRLLLEAQPDRSAPFTLGQGSVIPGWDKGLVGHEGRRPARADHPAEPRPTGRPAARRRSRRTRRSSSSSTCSSVSYGLVVRRRSAAPSRRARYSGSGSSTPLSRWRPANDQSNSSGAASRTSSVQSTLPGRAMPVTRLARLTEWPKKSPAAQHRGPARDPGPQARQLGLPRPPRRATARRRPAAGSRG